MSKMDSLPLDFESEDRQIFTVQQLNREVKELLQQNFPLIWVEGEISNIARPASGHIYFSLKDEYAQVRCAMFRNANRKLPFQPEDGMHVLVRARVGIYEPRGDYQLNIERMEEAGIGILQRKFDELKQKLSREGLFDQDNKKALPAYPNSLGIITSATGAALRDILSVLKRRFPLVQIRVYAVQVQGEQSAKAIIKAIQAINQEKECEVIILARGGGSIEDLWSFNEESVARAIYTSNLPIVTGIGHEVDFTIADFVADMRAATPSAAAELVVPHQHELIETLEQYNNALIYMIQDKIGNFYQSVDWFTQRLEYLHPEQIIARNKDKLTELKRRAFSALQLKISYQHSNLDKLLVRFENQSPKSLLQAANINLTNLRQILIRVVHNQIEQKSQQLATLSRTLNAISPLGTLNRGYAIVTKALNKQVLRNADDVDSGEKILIRLAQGSLSAHVDEK